MNWKHERGYKVSSTIRGKEREMGALFVIKANNGFAFIYPNILDPWSGGRIGHLVEATLVDENQHNCIVKNEADGTELTISEMGTDKIISVFNKIISEYKKEGETFEKQYQRMFDEYSDSEIQM